jgi:signal transduction histidine kinase
VAGRWRIRHKLMLGLGLVVAIIAILLTGTLRGLRSYRATMKSIDSKLTELNAALAFRECVSKLKATREQADSQRDFKILEPIFEEQLKDANQALAEYIKRLDDTVANARDPDKGYIEKNDVKGLKEHLDKLKNAFVNANTPVVTFGGPARSPCLRDETVQAEVTTLFTTANDLINALYGNMAKRIKTARRAYNLSLMIVLSTSVVGILLMAGLLRFFYSWVFHPIRALELGAGRVAGGDFDHRIEVHSGDEMEDLASAFNNMTGRLQEMYRDLARQVNERSRQLVRSERLAGVGFLAAGVAHEINNPLASIAFCSEALDRRLSEVLANLALRGALAKGDQELIGKYLKMIQQEAFRCKEITQRLLEFSRGGERRRDETNLVELVQGVLDVVQHLQNCKGKQLLFTPPPRLIAWVNGQEIKSVVLNLVVNALDSMDEGGTLTITLRQSDQMAEMVFADSGCGMTAEILENIFEPFYTRSRTGKGTGLGLSISHRIINQHGGEIEAVSPGPGQGSTFTVRLPLQPAEPAPAGGDKAAEEYPVFPAQTMGGRAA